MVSENVFPASPSFQEVNSCLDRVDLDVTRLGDSTVIDPHGFSSNQYCRYGDLTLAIIGVVCRSIGLFKQMAVPVPALVRSQTHHPGPALPRK